MTRKRNERGSAVIEAVIAIPAILLFVALVIAAGRIAMARQGVQTAAAEAARKRRPTPVPTPVRVLKPVVPVEPPKPATPTPGRRPRVTMAAVTVQVGVSGVAIRASNASAYSRSCVKTNLVKMLFWLFYKKANFSESCQFLMKTRLQPM